MSTSRKALAFRIVLTNALYEAEALVTLYKSEVEARSCFRPSAGDQVFAGSLDRVVQAAHRVVTYIQNCLLHEGSINLFLYGLSAVGSAQEALVSALAACRGNTEQNHYLQLYDEQTIRAKFIVNSLAAKIEQDHELASLWGLAAEEVQRRTELKCIGNTNDTSISKNTLMLTKQYLTKALPVNKCKSTEETELQQLASRHYRFAAVCTVLGRNHAHPYAAETYQQAAQWSRAAADTDVVPVTLKLWQAAVTSMRLAGDMIAAHTDENSAKKDTLITQTIATAKQMMDNARRVSTQLASVEEWSEKVVASKAAVNTCKNPFLAPVLQLLLEKQEKVHLASEKYLQMVLQSECQTQAAGELQQEVTWCKSETADIQVAVQKLKVLIQNAHLYRGYASQASKASHAIVRHILGDCWTKAADQAEHTLQLTTDLVEDGIVQTLAHDLSDVWQRRYEIVRNYAYIAENVLGNAVEYLDKARGAEAGEKSGRDPREAQMWRKAAECLLEKAEQMSSALSNGQNVSTARITLADLLQLSKYASERAEQYARAADYLCRSDQYCQLLDVQIHAQRVSNLYEKLASLTIVKYGLNAGTVPSALSTVMFEDSVFAFTFKFIELLTPSTLITPEQIALYERGCEYGHKYLLATYTNHKNGSLWKDAFEYCFSARNLLHPATPGNTNSIQDITHELAVASVYALGATGADQGRTFFGLACARAARAMNRHLKMENFKMYHFLLAERIIVMARSTDPNCSPDMAPVVIPTELQQLLPLEANDDPAYQDMLQEHAGACCLEAECEYQDSLARANNMHANPWVEAMQEVRNWIYYLELHAKHYHGADKPTTDDIGLLAFHKLTVSCYVAAARHAGNGALSSAWREVVEMSKHVTIEHIDTATTAIERMVRAVRAVESGDQELGALWQKAGSAARVVHERTVARSASIDAAWCEFKRADCTALARVAQREERRKLSAMWQKAAVKWKEAVTLCLLSPRPPVDTQLRRKVTVQLETLRKIRLEAEKLESAAMEAALMPADDEQAQGEKEEENAVADTAPAPALPSLVSALPAAELSRARSVPAPLPSVRRQPPVRGVANRAIQSVHSNTEESLAARRRGSAQSVPSHRTGAVTSAAPTAGRVIGAGTLTGAASGAPDRPLSSRSITGAGSARATATNNPTVGTKATNSAVKMTSIKK